MSVRDKIDRDRDKHRKLKNEEIFLQKKDKATAANRQIC